MAELAVVLDNYLDAIAARLAQRLGPVPATTDKRLFDLAEAAHYLGRSENAVKLLYHRGKLPGTKIDSKLQFDKRALDKLIDDCTFFEQGYRT